ncbi:MULTISPECIES: hypothetical protein [Dyella]|uniref:Uncharacterized protein n=2 Tax=Dyella TaxID=231454 RepID=A0A4R0Z4W3_9GAMM|nr:MULTISPECIES: hypothetical protein [Dyella]TBR38988.1 hypothetical protein EYV96_01710 [Dyella terrae]TCI13420.1 hypothetical protein EZM97_09160 [Dyella soli]
MQLAGITGSSGVAHINSSLASDGNATPSEPAQNLRSATQTEQGSKASSTGSSVDGPIEMLKKSIERLQKQLAELQRQLAHAVQTHRKDEGPDATVMALQSQIASVTAALQKAVAALAELMMSAGSQASGALVNTSA